MKRMNLTGLLMGALISFSLTSAYGSIPFPYELTAKSTTVTFSEVNSGAKLYIKDQLGETLYFEMIRTDGSYTKRFELSGLPENRYYFELDKANEITIVPFEVGSEKVTLLHELKEDIAKPELRATDEEVFLTRDVEDAQSLDVEIYYEGRDLVYSEKIEKDGIFIKKYDFSGSVSGEYLFYIKYANRVYMQYVDIR